MLSDQTKSIRVRDVLSAAAFFPADADPVGATVCTHLDQVAPGGLFVHEDAFDSSDAEAAEARGAAAVIAERILPGVRIPQVIVDDCREAGRLLSEHASRPIEPSVLRIHVAGARGAERTALTLAARHAAAGERVGLLTESCEDDGEACLPRRRNSSRGPEWWARRCELSGVSTAIVATTPRLHAEQTPLVVCLTSLRCDALNETGEVAWENSEAHREAILAAVGRIDSGVTLVVNADDPDCVRFASSHWGRVVMFGETERADLRGVVLDQQAGGQELLITAGGESAALEIEAPGRGARRDTLAAIATAMAVGMDLTAAVADHGVAPRTPLSLETVQSGQPFGLRLDRAMGPLDLAEAIEGVTVGGERAYVALRLADDPRVATRQLNTAARMADRVLAHGDAAMLDRLPPNATVVEDRLAAMAVVLGLADEGDTVLVAGCRDQGNDRDTADMLLRRRLECEDRRAAA
ncbi:MurE-like ligase [Planctomycetes bacterium MalM25]|nr:MurE-like ligase [Planctomycetes bacterium MalM25]